MRRSGGQDVLAVLGSDLSSIIFSMLDDPADIVRATCVSRSWFQFVIKNGFCKSLCIKLFPEVSNSIRAIEVDNVVDFEVVSSFFGELVTARKNHNVYATLARGLSPILRNDCFFRAIDASSTDNDPLRSINNTIGPSERNGANSSYWSRTGSIDDGVPETFTYKLASRLCFITEINIRPFQAYFLHGLPIYPAKAVRFRVGYFKLSMIPADNQYVWTYESPEYPMTQEHVLQKFKLPTPVLCVGQILQVELLGRVQRCSHRLFYTCTTQFQVVVRPLLPEFERKLLNRSGNRAVFTPGFISQ